MTTADSLIKHYGMHRHPEGGYYLETYRSPEIINQDSLPARFGGSRSFCTAIYFLLVGNEFSAFHRIQSDEIWHYYQGNPVEVVMIQEDGQAEKIIVGPDWTSGQHFQYTVKAGTWFASRCVNDAGFSFVGCTVAPGFDFADFELANRDALIARYPQHNALITAFCRHGLV